MADKALSYWTGTIVDASPDLTTETIIARIDGVAGNPYAQHVSVEVSVSVTPGADTERLYFNVRSDSVTGAIIGQEETPFAVTAELATTCSFIVQGQIPVGSGSIVVTIFQEDATADAEILAVTAVALVGS